MSRETISNFMTAQIRTYVPMVIGAFISWLAVHGVTVDTTMQANLVIGMTTALQIAYYFIARVIEKRWPKAGTWLLGSSKQPEYKEPPASV